MVERIKQFNPDKDDGDVPFRSEDDESKDKTEDGFIPTENELIALAKYWHKDLLDREWLFDFLHPQAGDHRRRMSAYSQLKSIRKILGDEKVDEAREEVIKEFKAGISDELWAVFEHGDPAQRDAVEREAHAFVSGDRKVLATLTYLEYPEIPSPDRTKKVGVRLRPKEMADLEAASRRLETSPADILRKGAALYIHAKRAKRKSNRKAAK